MYRRVAIVTDSTADLPDADVGRLGIAVVQMQLRVGDQVDDEARVPTDALVRAMEDRVEVATAPPDAGALFWAYQEAWGHGAEAVVSMHISGRQSATCEAARAAAERSKIPVHVIDSHTAGMSLGHGVIAAADAANRGGDVSAVIAAAERRWSQGLELIYVDTLEYLRRGGRIGPAAALVGTALSMKPLLTVADGAITPLERVMGTDRALRRMVDLAAKKARGAQVDVAVEHFAAPDRAETLLRALRSRIPGGHNFTLTQVSSAIGAHVGPGALGVSISPH
ncbi:DegV family protein [Solihabitans fulvus]|uniref:DegV family protein n=1 Tax=Solihabitans fulvus TaxID=1892852 RepID=A0A5B2X7P6_9PSEU|nr:DegV family protein [Solihabitans fulvus]KAA2259538.1 DegV family protein [Solihabitans fulvus]